MQNQFADETKGKSLANSKSNAYLGKMIFLRKSESKFKRIRDPSKRILLIGL